MTKEQSWSEWLTANVARNCDKDELYRILLDNGFCHTDAALMLERASSNSQPGYFPNAIPIYNDKVEMYGIDGFLNAEECTQLIELIRNNRRQSTTTEEGVSSFRTSTTCELASLDHPIVELIDQRICEYMGIDPCQSEPIEGQWYEVGQEFKAHTDYFEPDSETYDQHIGSLGQRTWTFMIYLNTTRDGGGTHFSEIDVEVQPVSGTALLWNNTDHQGNLNQYTLHHGMPVTAGYKAVITKWFRSTNGKPEYKKEENEHIAPLTRTGFQKNTIPENLYKTLFNFYRENRDNQIGEHIPDFISSDNKTQPSVLIELTDRLRAETHAALQPVVEAWVGDYLEPTFVYGIREYLDGAVLKPHRDRTDTHVASVILNIDQDVQQDWPLLIEDHFYRQHEVVLKPGEMILYEGARLKHGRPQPLQGDRFANVFVHFKQTQTADSAVTSLRGSV